jgi:hypothetical protein
MPYRVRIHGIPVECDTSDEATALAYLVGPHSEPIPRCDFPRLTYREAGARVLDLLRSRGSMWPWDLAFHVYGQDDDDSRMRINNVLRYVSSRLGVPVTRDDMGRVCLVVAHVPHPRRTFQSRTHLSA